MDYDDVERHSLHYVEQTMHRYSVRSEHSFKVCWKHMPSYYLGAGGFKCYVN